MSGISSFTISENFGENVNNKLFRFAGVLSFRNKRLWSSSMRVSMGLTDRRKTAKNLVDSRKN